MKKINLTLAYFSPTDTTKTTLKNIAQGMGCVEYKEIDFTEFDSRWEKRTFSDDELVLFAMPVYYGRLPVVEREIFRSIKAMDTPVVPIVVYGNINYDDALLELKNNLEDVGFKTIGAGVFLGEHSMNPSVAKSRPDKEDLIKQLEFGEHLKEKYINLTNMENANVEVPGNFPYRDGADTPLAPQLVGECKDCSSCSEICPMFAINPNDPSKVDSFRCILCFRCVRNCTDGARQIAHEKLKLGLAALVLRGRQRREPEIFI